MKVNLSFVVSSADGSHAFDEDVTEVTPAVAAALATGDFESLGWIELSEDERKLVAAAKKALAAAKKAVAAPPAEETEATEPAADGELHDLNVAQLRALAKAAGVAGFSKLTKAELLDALAELDE